MRDVSLNLSILFNLYTNAFMQLFKYNYIGLYMQLYTLSTSRSWIYPGQTHAASIKIWLGLYKYIYIYIYIYYVCMHVCMNVCNNNNRYFFIYKLLAPSKHGVRSQLVQKSSQKELQSKARWVRLNRDTV